MAQPVPVITAEELADLIGVGRTPHLIDVREEDEYLQGHVPEAVNLPLSALTTAAGHLPARGPIYVICASGNRSEKAAAVLRRAGLDARTVDGGTRGWIRQHHPIATGTTPKGTHR